MDQSTEARHDRDQGFVLIVVIWGIGLLLVLAVTFNAAVRTHTRITANAIINGQAEAAADAGIHLGVMQLLDITSGGDGSVLGIPVNGSTYTCRLSDATIIRITIEDEGGKVDLNAAPAPLLAAVFAGFGAEQGTAQALAEAVLDFRDPDDSARPNGAEIREYVEGGRAYGPANRNFLAVEELEQVLGMTQALYQSLRPFITVHSKRSGVDPIAASPTLLAALTQTPEDLPDTSSQDIETLRASFDFPAGYGTASARHAFLIRAEGHHTSGGLFIREAIVDVTRRREREFSFVAWRQGRRRQAATDGIDVPPAADWNALERLSRGSC